MRRDLARPILYEPEPYTWRDFVRVGLYTVWLALWALVGLAFLLLASVQ